MIIYILAKHKWEMMLYSPKPKQKLLKLKIIDITGKQHVVQLSPRLTGFQLKDYLFDSLCKELKQKEMRVTYEGAELADNTKISQFNVAVGNMLIFKQEKITLNQVSKIMVHNIEDEVFFEQYQYQWPCGHYIGQAGIVAHIKAVIAKEEYAIKCPFELPNGTKCNFQWDYSVCKKIGVLTAQEKMDFQVALSQNYMKQHEKLCPKCNQKILKEADSNRVRCPYPTCKFGDFCFRCLGTWSNGQSNTFCGNQTCRFAFEYLASAQWDRIFTVRDTKKNNTPINVKTPHYRSCPKCHMVCENYTACKHTTCTCNTKFCWICLAVYNNKWPCGAHNEYCGSVAQVQTYSVKH